MSLATASNWFWNWAIAFAVPYISKSAIPRPFSLIRAILLASTLDFGLISDWM